MTNDIHNVLIIGAGVAGLTAQYVLRQHGEDPLVIEKDDAVGGLCRSWTMHGAWFDHGIHATFAKDQFVRDLFESGVRYTDCSVGTMNYKKGYWLRGHTQNNLYPLPTDEKIKIISDFANRPIIDEPHDYDEWLRTSYGDYFTDNYPALYTRKYWTVEPKQLETKWVGIRMHRPSLEEVLYGAFEQDAPNIYYAKDVRYPLDGGYEAFISNMRKDADVMLNSRIAEIDPSEKTVKLADGTELRYGHLIAAAPLPEITPLIRGVPQDVLRAAHDLDHTSLILVSLCLKRRPDWPHDFQSGFFYIYDEEILTPRVYSTDDYRPGEREHYALQAEVYYSRYRPLSMSPSTIMEKTIDQLASIGVISRDDIVETDVRDIRYANVLFTHDIYKDRSKVRDYMSANSIVTAGRFGEWDYLWSDQATLSGRRAAEDTLRAMGRL